MNSWLFCYIIYIVQAKRFSDVKKESGERMSKKRIAALSVLVIFAISQIAGCAVKSQPDSQTRTSYMAILVVALSLVIVIITVLTVIISKNRVGIKQSAKALKEREVMLETLNKAAIVFLSQNKESFEEMMAAGIGQIANLFAIDRFSLFRNFDMPDGLHTSQIYRWDMVSGGTTPSNEMYSDVTYAGFAPSWEHILGGGDIINGPGRLMPEKEAATLKAAGVISAFIIPVFNDNLFWGFAFFEDRNNERYFDDNCVEIMRSAAFLCANAIIRNEMEREIEKANNRTKILLDKTPLCCQLWDSNLKKIDCNEAAVKLFGFKDKQDYLNRYTELYPEYQPDGQRTVEKSFKSVKKAFDEGGYTLDWTYKMLDGTSMPTEITLVRVEYEDGYGVAGYTRDLREHKKMMKTLYSRDHLLDAVNRAASVLLAVEDSNNFLPSLLEGMEIVARCVNVDCVEIWQNKMIDGELHAIMKNYWYNNETLKAKPEDALHNFPYSATPDWENRLSRGECIQGSLFTLLPEDRTFISDFGIQSLLTIPVFMENRLWGMCCFDDYTECRDFSNDELNILRSCGLMFANALLRNDMVMSIRDTSAKLETALEQAKAASKAKGDFLSAMSHEMRTPMNAIIGMTAIGKKANDIAGKNHALDKIGGASSHLIGIINDVLDMAKIEANKLELNPIEFNFARLLQRVLTVVNFRIDEKQQTLSMNISNDIPAFLVGDEQRLAQVMTNLLSNAVKFTPEGGKIHIDACWVCENGIECELRIEVSDNGIGIDPRQNERLFNMFEQAEPGISREYGGTGLGLVIAKNIVELMGGRIWVESELGKGARFIFTVKIQSGTKSSESACDCFETAHAENCDRYKEGEFAGKRLLLVEDVEINREILLMLLEDTGLMIDCAENGKEALDMVAKAPDRYDIVFMDVQMPKMDGLEATRRIRALPETYNCQGEKKLPRLPIIAMTANVFKDDIEICLASGMDDHLGKPLDIDKVFEKLREYLKS